MIKIICIAEEAVQWNRTENPEIDLSTRGNLAMITSNARERKRAGHVCTKYQLNLCLSKHFHINED